MRKQNLSSEGQHNSDNLIYLLKHRLHDSSKAKSVDAHGNTIFIDCDIYTKEMCEAFINLAISEFNSTPGFTSFTLENSRFVDCFAETIVEGATLDALASKALIERGREYQITDNGIEMQPPAVSEMLNTQFSILLNHHWEKLKHIKSHIHSFSG